jgi:hypothetical protein
VAVGLTVAELPVTGTPFKESDLSGEPPSAMFHVSVADSPLAIDGGAAVKAVTEGGVGAGATGSESSI